ncbi:ABC transporter, substrate-binding protein, QAT family [Acetobacteraceae bacterium AT-5844]|nr:ABC transporter, substrate-binding protein, QAT family [Acetobacteraceae bacterium AT-5844]
MRPMMTRRSMLLGTAALALMIRWPAFAQSRRVVVSSKLDTESALLGEMIAQVLEAKGVGVERKLQLGPTRILRSAILAGEIDIYPEYTGNGAFFFNMEADAAWHDAAKAYEKVRTLDAERNRIVWLKPASANNTWAIAVRRDTAPSGQTLDSLEDLARLLGTSWKPQFKLAASAEFVESPAALPAFQSAYGFKLEPSNLLVLAGGDTAVTMRAAAEKLNGVNAAMVYGTDGAISALELKVLADPRGAQMVYQPAPCVRGEVASAHPQLAEWLAPVFDSLTLTGLQALNAKIVVEGQNQREVARGQLRGLGIGG